jgi:hypothetical protein
MPTRIEVHPTAKIAAYAVGCALLVASGIFGLQRLSRSGTQSAAIPGTQPAKELLLSKSSGWLLVPVIELQITDATQERNWSAALASLLSAQTEVPVEGGRVDVLTDHYAIEVDRLDKWHEAIGQAAHYALKTQKIPAAALMVPSDSWPISEATRAKLLLIDETCTKQGIKLILLHRTGA